MKSLLFVVIFMFLNFYLRAQKEVTGSDEVIKTVQLQDVNIIASRQSTFNSSTFNLIRYSTRSKIELLCSENIAIYVPSEIDTFLLIESVEIPFRKLSNRIVNLPKFFIKTSNSPSDSLIPLIPKEISISKNKMRVMFNQAINLNLKCSGFFFAFNPNCPSLDYSSGYQLKFTYNFHSKITFKYDSKKKFIINDFRKGILHNKKGFPNWQLKLSFKTVK